MALSAARIAFRTLSLLLAIQALTCGGVQVDIQPEGENSRDQQGALDDGMMVESYLEEQSSESGAFGADILQEFHLRSLECRMNVSAVEHTYQVRLGNLLNYYEANKKAMATRNFETLTNHTRKEVEKNIRNTIRTVEQERVTKIKQVANTCKEKIKKWLEGKLVETVNQGKHILTRNPSAFEGTLRAVRLFQSRLYSHKRACTRPGGSRSSTVTCDPLDLQLLLNFTSALIGRMDYIKDSFTFIDDEDLSAPRIGSGEDLDGHVEPSLSKLGEIKLDNRVSSTDPPASSTSDELAEEPSSSYPHQSTHHQRNHRHKVKSRDHLEATPSKIASSTEANIGDSGSDEDTSRDIKVSLATHAPTSKMEPSTVAEQLPKTERIDEERGEESSKLLSQNTGDDVIIIEPQPHPQEAQTSHTSSRGHHQVIVVLVVLVTVILAASLAIVAVLTYLVVKKRQKHKAGYIRVQVSSETETTNDTLEEIKKSGYVNPTYKFYTRC